jgi:rhamnulokinase
MFTAVDLGASQGRVIVGGVSGRLRLTEVHRFPNIPVRLPDGLHWDILALYREILDGLRAAMAHQPVSLGLDSWAVDYGLLDADGLLLGNPYHYRDSRTTHAIRAVHQRVPADELYRINGLQQMPINTIYQLAAAKPTAQFRQARTLLMVPDLLTYWLTGEIGGEGTIASSTGLFDARTHDWSRNLAQRMDISSTLFPELREPGTPIGVTRPETGVGGIPVATVASHDTASAVSAVPARGESFAYISCGTWSLAGIELDAPVLTDAARKAMFTNELGIDRTVRFLHNIMGLWLLQECVRCWEHAGERINAPRLVEQAAKQPAFAALVNPDDPAFLAPEDMPAAVAEFCVRTDQRPPSTPAATARCILESLALAHRSTLRAACALSGRDIDVVHIVGGGSRNELLCQLTADACGLPVIAGPAEATAIGNILAQARADGQVADRAAGRSLVADALEMRRYQPRGQERDWAAAATRVGLAV